MTPKQIERIHNKIKKIRKSLADEKKLYGAYLDGRGLRYAPIELYLKIQDFKGGLTYLRWFNKNFPKDFLMPDFMFQSAFVYFENKKLKEAELCVVQTYYSDPLFIPIFLDRKINEVENVNLDAYKSFFTYLNSFCDLNNYKSWLIEFDESDTLKSELLKIRN